LAFPRLPPARCSARRARKKSAQKKKGEGAAFNITLLKPEGRWGGKGKKREDLSRRGSGPVLEGKREGRKKKREGGKEGVRICLGQLGNQGIKKKQKKSADILVIVGRQKKQGTLA